MSSFAATCRAGKPRARNRYPHTHCSFPFGTAVSKPTRLILLIIGLLGCARLRALEWETGPGFRRAALAVPASGKAGFTRLSPAETGIHFTNQLSEARSLANRNLLSGSGVACGDVDGDGWIDLYFCNLDGTNALFRNLGGWKFEDITASAGVGCPGQDSMGCALVDVDGDGDLDLLVNALGIGTRLFLNDGKAHFTEVTQQAGLASRTGSTSMALADIDGDGAFPTLRKRR